MRLLIGLLAAIVVTGAHAAAPRFTVTEIPNPGGDHCAPRSINKYGTVLATCRHAASDAAYAYTWRTSSSEAVEIDGLESVKAINDQEQFIGQRTADDGVTVGFMRDPHDGVFDIRSRRQPEERVLVTDINNKGTVTVNSTLKQRPFLWNKDREDRVLTRQYHRFDAYRAIAINDIEWVIGQAFYGCTRGDDGLDCPYERTAVEWKGAHLKMNLCCYEKLDPVDINSSQMSVGTIYRPLAAAAVHSSWGNQGTGYRVLPLVAGAASAIPSSIGDRGDVVGTSFGPEGALLGGFWWDSANGVRDLGSLIRSVDAQGHSYAIAAVIGNNSQGQVLVQVRSGLSDKPRMARLDPSEK